MSVQLSINPVSALVKALRTNYAPSYGNNYADSDSYAYAYANASSDIYDYVDAYDYANAYSNANANAYDYAGKLQPLLKHESFMIKITLVCRMNWETL